eukprot:1572725-Alexandrium_andersonii.AAC.1
MPSSTLAMSLTRSGKARPAAAASCAPKAVARSKRYVGTKGRRKPEGPTWGERARRAGGPGRTTPAPAPSSGSTASGRSSASRPRSPASASPSDPGDAAPPRPPPTTTNGGPSAEAAT